MTPQVHWWMISVPWAKLNPTLDLLIAIQVHMERLDIQGDPQCPITLHHVVLLGTLELGQTPQENGQVGQVVIRPLREQHDHILAATLPKHVQDGRARVQSIVEPSASLPQ